MSQNPRAVASLGLGFGALAVATLGLIVATMPATDVVGCASATTATADIAEAVMHQTDCAEAIGESADLASLTSLTADTASCVDELSDLANATAATADTATIVAEAC
jgi:hypothetical protein